MAGPRSGELHGLAERWDELAQQLAACDSRRRRRAATQPGAYNCAMNGKRIAILESRFSDHLAQLLRRQGAEVLQAPALSEVPDVDAARIAELVDALNAEPARLFVFQTGVGTRALFETTDASGRTASLLALLAQGRVAVRGPKPTAVLKGRGVRIDFSAADPFTTAELLAAIAGVDIAGGRVVVQRYGETNEELDHALAARGAAVIEIPTYRWALPEDTAPLERLIGALRAGELDAVVFTSASQVRNLLAVASKLSLPEPVTALLNRTMVASIGPVCSRALREAGVAVGLEAAPPKLGPLVAALNDGLRGA
jgi:uroporphyrinogen-III synthase